MILSMGSAPKPIELGRRSGTTGEPVIRIHCVDPELDLPFLLYHSYLVFADHLGKEEDYRIFFATLQGEVGLYTAAIPAGHLEKFKEALHEFSGWYYIELVLPTEVLSFYCNGYVDATGIVPQAVEALRNGTLTGIMESIERLKAKFPRMKYLRILEYLIVLETSDEETAIAYVKDEVAIFPNEFIALTILGNYFHRQGRFQRSRVFYERAIGISPYHPSTLYYLMDIALRQKNDADLLTYLPRWLALRQPPASFEARVHKESRRLFPDGLNLPSSGLVRFFLDQESIFRKAAFEKVLHDINHYHNLLAEEDQTHFSCWALALLRNLPERLPPYFRPSFLNDCCSLVDKLNPQGDKRLDLATGRCFDQMLQRFSHRITPKELEHFKDRLKVLASRNSDVVDFSSFLIRIQVLQIQGAVEKGEMERFQSILEELKSFLLTDPHNMISSYTVINNFNHILEQLLLQGHHHHHSNVCDCVVAIWQSILMILKSFPAYANYTPLLISLKRWSETTHDKHIEEKIEEMVLDFQTFIIAVTDRATLANIAKTAKITGFERLSEFIGATS